jgi:hypothetical protein
MVLEYILKVSQYINHNIEEKKGEDAGEKNKDNGLQDIAV